MHRFMDNKARQGIPCTAAEWVGGLGAALCSAFRLSGVDRTRVASDHFSLSAAPYLHIILAEREEGYWDSRRRSKRKSRVLVVEEKE